MKHLPRLERNWFFISFGISFAVIVVYLLLHWGLDGEAMSVNLNKKDISAINSILDSDSLETNKKEEVIFYLDQMLGVDSISLAQQKYSSSEIRAINDLYSTAHTINQYSVTALKPILPFLSFTRPAPFWLKGSRAILEIVFWAFFGLAASVLYRGSEAIKSKQFDVRKIPVHLAKIIYAPLSAIVIFFSVDALILSSNISITNINYWTIVLSFILGFFSGRTVELLRRIKDIVLPLGSDKEEGYSGDIPRYVINGKVKFNDRLVSNIPKDKSKAIIEIHSLANPKKAPLHVAVKRDGSFQTTALPEGLHSFTTTMTSTENGETRFFRKEETVNINKKAESSPFEVYLNEIDPS